MDNTNLKSLYDSLSAQSRFSFRSDTIRVDRMLGDLAALSARSFQVNFYVFREKLA